MFLDAQEKVIGYYTASENSIVWHTYHSDILKIKIPEGVSKLVINSYDKNTLGAKIYVRNKLNENSIEDLPNNIVDKQNFVPYLGSLYDDNYANVPYTSSTGFMENTEN